MNNTVQIACQIDTSDATACLGLEIRLDNTTIFNSEHIRESVKFVYDLADDDGEHVLEFVMKNKTDTHTKIDEQGNIIKDARLIISDLAFDEIALNQMFVNQAVYTHNFNGTQAQTQTKFYGEMGCNGTVSLEFTTPIYLWLLEHM